MAPTAERPLQPAWRDKIHPLDTHLLRLSLTTRLVPFGAMAELLPLAHRPRVGQLVVGEVLKIGKHTAIEDRNGLAVRVFPGDRIVGAFGNRYATDQYEGYVPRRATRRCDLLSIGGVCGAVASRHDSVRTPTRLRVLGLVGDGHGRPLNLHDFAVEPGSRHGAGRVIVVVGSSMSSGKTTLAGALVRGLIGKGLRVAAGKLTGTAAGKDTRFYVSCGADPVLDFIDAGFPSTYMVDQDELLGIVDRLVSRLRASTPDYIVLEVADGIFQRETAMLLRSTEFRASVDHAFFAANDSLSAESGVRHLRQYGFPLRAVSGLVTRGPLLMREAEAATGVPCLTPDRIADGAALELLRVPELLLARVPSPEVNGLAGEATENGTAKREPSLHLVN